MEQQTNAALGRLSVEVSRSRTIRQKRARARTHTPGRTPLNEPSSVLRSLDHAQLDKNAHARAHASTHPVGLL